MRIRSRFATPLLLAALAAVPSTSAAEDITLTGCLVKGEGDREGYLLRNASGDPGWQRSADLDVVPDTIGTSGGFEAVFYWLEDDNEMRKHVGHRVEVSGALEGDLEDGEVEMDRKDNWTELTVKSDGRKMKAMVPNNSLLAGTNDNGDRKVRVLVRKVDVEKVRMLSATCDGQ